jgi:hypothetical protein
MIDLFEVGRARVFLEASGVVEILAGVSPYEWGVLRKNGAVKWLCQAADRELELGGALNRYVDANPDIPIDTTPNNGWKEWESFFKQNTDSPWDCCSIDRKALRFKEGTAYLLVEYQIKKSTQFSENDRKFIYLEGMRMFASDLSQIKSERLELSQEQALQKAFMAVATRMMKRYGLPQKMLAEILKEGREKWRLIHEATDSSIRFSLSRHSRCPRIREFFYPNDDNPIKRIAENMAENQKAGYTPKIHEGYYKPVVVKKNVTGVEDAIDVEYEMRMEEIRKNRKNDGSL